MWERIRREIFIEYYWWKRHSVKKRRADSPLGLMGILFIISGIFLMILIGQAFATMFRSMMPIVSGTQIAGAYWSSVFFALKVCIILIVLIVSMIGFLIYRFSKRRR